MEFWGFKILLLKLLKFLIAFNPLKQGFKGKLKV